MPRASYSAALSHSFLILRWEKSAASKQRRKEGAGELFFWQRISRRHFCGLIPVVQEWLVLKRQAAHLRPEVLTQLTWAGSHENLLVAVLWSNLLFFSAPPFSIDCCALSCHPENRLSPSPDSVNLLSELIHHEQVLNLRELPNYFLYNSIIGLSWERVEEVLVYERKCSRLNKLLVKYKPLLVRCELQAPEGITGITGITVGDLESSLDCLNGIVVYARVGMRAWVCRG